MNTFTVYLLLIVLVLILFILFNKSEIFKDNFCNLLNNIRDKISEKFNNYTANNNENNLSLYDDFDLIGCDIDNLSEFVNSVNVDDIID